VRGEAAPQTLTVDDEAAVNALAKPVGIAGYNIGCPIHSFLARKAVVGERPDFDDCRLGSEQVIRQRIRFVAIRKCRSRAQCATREIAHNTDSPASAANAVFVLECSRLALRSLYFATPRRLDNSASINCSRLCEKLAFCRPTTDDGKLEMAVRGSSGKRPLVARTRVCQRSMLTVERSRCARETQHSECRVLVFGKPSVGVKVDPGCA
jgi:hypothetical protein